MVLSHAQRVAPGMEIGELVTVVELVRMCLYRVFHLADQELEEFQFFGTTQDVTYSEEGCVLWEGGELGVFSSNTMK